MGCGASKDGNASAAAVKAHASHPPSAPPKAGQRVSSSPRSSIVPPPVAAGPHAAEEEVEAGETAEQAFEFFVQGNTLKDQGKLPEAFKMYQRALKTYVALHGEDNANVAAILSNMGMVLNSQGKFKEALRKYERVRRFRSGTENSSLAGTLMNIAIVHNNLGDYMLAAKMQEHALRIYITENGEKHPVVAATEASLLQSCEMLRLKGEYQHSLEAFEKAVGHAAAIHGGMDKVEVAEIQNNLGLCYYKLGQYPKALEIFEAALKTYEETHGENHDGTATTICNIANVFLSQREYETATELYNRAIEIKTALHGENCADVAVLLGNKGRVVRMQGGFPLKTYEKALEIKMNIFGERHTSTATTLNDIGEVQRLAGEFAKSRATHEKALGIFRELCGEKHDLTARTMHLLALTLENLEHRVMALQLLETAKNIYLSTLSPTHGEVVEINADIKRAQAVIDAMK